MNWKELFESKVLKRGKTYFENGYVAEPELDGNTLTAVVEGSEDYDVSVTLQDGEPIEMECTCPYAAEWGNCKHMAAVMYAYEAGNVLTLPKPKGSKPQIEEQIANADADVLRSFLYRAVTRDRALRSELELFLSRSAGEIDLKMYQKNIKATIRQYEDRHNFIDYGNAEGFIDEMLKYLEEDIAEMTKQGHIPEAFSLCNYLFKAVSDVDMDDSDGGLMMFGDSTAEAWKEMISRADCEQKAAMFQWFRSHLDDYVIDYMEEYIEQVFYDAFEEKEYALQKLEIVDGLIAGKNEKDYGYEKLILRRVQIMEQSNLPFREIAAYCSGYEELSGVRQFLIHRFLSHRKKEKAIELLERFLILDQRYPGLVRQYRIQLKELYRESGETEKYRIQLWLLVTIDGDLDCFRELKALYSDAEWVTVSEKVYAETGACYIASFYAEEKR